MLAILLLLLWVSLLHEQEGEEHLEHALAVGHVVSIAVEFNHAHGVLVLVWVVLKDWCPRYVTSHLGCVLPALLNLLLFGSELLDVILHFFAEEDLL